uniref:Uncharacterized protein n=1 Tax=Opuntia streptacantha TaxID=393608 RepID=A0A7C8ZBY0_OPUST
MCYPFTQTSVKWKPDRQMMYLFLRCSNLYLVCSSSTPSILLRLLISKLKVMQQCEFATCSQYHTSLSLFKLPLDSFVYSICRLSLLQYQHCQFTCGLFDVT